MERPTKKPNYPTHTSQRHKGGRFAGGNFIYEIYSSGGRRINRISNLGIFSLSVLAGAFICAGTLLSVLLVTNVTSASMQFLLTGIGLTLGFLLVILTNSTLATEANIFVPPNFYNISIGHACSRLFRFWLISWIGNVIGAFLFALIVYWSQQYSSAFQQNLYTQLTTKLLHTNALTYKGTGELILSGMLANWLIALVAFFIWTSRNLINQFIIIFLVFTLIAAAQFQYFPFNLSYVSLNAFLGKPIRLTDVFVYNLIPVSLGNILSAALLVAGSLLFLSKKR